MPMTTKYITDTLTQKHKATDFMNVYIKHLKFNLNSQPQESMYIYCVIGLAICMICGMYM